MRQPRNLQCKYCSSTLDLNTHSGERNRGRRHLFALKIPPETVKVALFELLSATFAHPKCHSRRVQVPFSVVVYRPLIYLVHYSRCSELNQQWNITKFNSCLPLQPKRDELEDNGKGYIGRVAELFDEKISGLQQPEEMTNEYIDEANAYLHIQGHQLYKLVLQIGSMLCKGKGVAFKTEILDKAVHTEGYNEIENVQLDLMQILA